MRFFPVSRPTIGQEESVAVAATLGGGQVSMGPRVALFERELGRRLGAEHVVACASGTAALHLALAALGVGPGDEVLVPNLTFIATANAPCYVGARPVLVDVDPVTWNIDLEDAARKLTDNTVAIIPVHLYGVPCDMDAVAAFAQRNLLFVIEDAAEGLGGAWNGRALGTHGTVGCFSFYANKILTTVEGGAIVTADPDIAEALRLLRGQGQGQRRFFHERLGFNYRLSDLHAAVGLAQLRQLDAFLAQRHEIFARYREALAPLAPRPGVPGEAPWLFTLELPEGVDVTTVSLRLLRLGIETRPVFVPISQQPPHATEVEFPVSERIAERGVSLPTYVGMTGEDIQFVSESLLLAVRS